jgi:hypothetical protein
MRSSLFRQSFSVLAACTLLATPAFAFHFPLSSEAVREAYFLGQRRDDSMARCLDTYARHLAAPKTGPYISSIQFLTPFAQLIRHSSEHSLGYSAQQAEQDHHGDKETVEISVEILLTNTYGAFLTDPAPARPSSPYTYRLRSAGFWSDFQVQVFEGDKIIEPSSYNGKPNYLCSEGGCTLSGATILLDFPAAAFDSDSVTIEVTPPEGEPVATDFDLTHLR